LTPNDPYSGRTAPLTSKVAFYATNIGTEYFKRGIYSPFVPLQNAVCFIILTYLVPILFTFYLQGVLKLKKNNSGAKRLRGFWYFCVLCPGSVRTLTDEWCWLLLYFFPILLLIFPFTVFILSGCLTYYRP